MNRRDFIRSTARIALITAAYPLPTLADKNVELLITPFSPPEQKEYDVISLLSIADQKLRVVRAPKIDAHGVAQHPNQSHLALVFGQATQKSLLIDTREGRILKVFSSSKGRNFYGHGQYTPDGRRFYATEYEREGNSGAIVIRDAEDFRELGVFPSHGLNPHEIYLTPDYKTAVIANQGRAATPDSQPLDASLTYVDVASGKLLHKIETQHHSTQFGHLAVDRDGSVVIGADHKLEMVKGTGGAKSKYRHLPTPLIFGGIGKATIERFPLAQEIKARTLNSLSLAISEPARSVAISYTEGHSVHVWSLKNHSLRGILPIRLPLGVAAIDGGKYFAINTVESELHIVDAESLKLIRTVKLTDLFRGPHLIRLRA